MSTCQNTCVPCVPPFVFPDAFGQGEIVVPDLATVAALPTGQRNIAGRNRIPDAAYARPLTVDQPFELDRASTAPADGITILNTADSAGGTLPGRWLRIETFNKHWSLQITWFINPLTGDDENTGTAATQTTGTHVGPLKSVAEAGRRLHQAQAGKNYQFNLLGDVPAVEATPRPLGTFAISDNYRMSFVAEQNSEDVNPANGYEQTFDATLSGLPLASATVIATGAIVGPVVVTSPTSGGGGNQQEVTDGSGALQANIGNMILMTSGAAIGATAGIGAATATPNQVRTSIFLTPGNARIVPAAGDTFAIIQLTRWNRPIIQLASSQGRFLIQNLEFPNVPAAPAEQQIISYRYMSLTWSRCRFRRNSLTGVAGINGTAFEVSNMANTALNGCILDYHGLTGGGVTGNPLISGGGPLMAIVVLGNGSSLAALNGCVLLNAEVRIVRNSEVQFTSCYVQAGQVKTFNPSTFESYGFFNVGAGTTYAEIQLFGEGLGIFDWPVASAGIDDSGMHIVGDSKLIATPSAGGLSCSLYGQSTSVNSIGYRGDAGGKFFWLTPGATAPTIQGQLHDLQLEHSAIAAQPLENWSGTAVGANYPAQVALNLWTDWSAAVVLGTSGFARKVMNYGTGAVIAQALGT